MGKELRCNARHGELRSEGKALLATDELLFRGDFRVAVPLKALSGAEAVDGWLHLRWPEGELSLELGAQAVKWLEAIRNPKGLLDKLGVKPGMRVAVLGMHDEGFLEQLRARQVELASGEALPEADLLFFGAMEKGALEALAGLRSTIKRNGAIWVVSPKGRKEIREADVMHEVAQKNCADAEMNSTSAPHLVPIAWVKM